MGSQDVGGAARPLEAMGEGPSCLSQLQGQPEALVNPPLGPQPPSAHDLLPVSERTLPPDFPLLRGTLPTGLGPTLTWYGPP